MPKIYIVFNKESRKVSYVTGDKGAFEFMKDPLVKEIEIEGEEFNLARFRWEGDYDTGQLVDLFKEKRAIVTEKEVDEKYYGLFFRKYPLEEVLFNIIENVNFTQENGEFNFGRDMQLFLKSLLWKKEQEIKKYKESKNHIYETRDEQVQRMKDSFKTNNVD